MLILVGVLTLALMGISLAAAAASIDITLGTTPTLDATISTGEWTDAGSVNISVGGTNGTVYFKHDGKDLYLAFEYNAGQMAEVFVDMNNDAGTAPQNDDVCLHASTALMEKTGTGVDWSRWNTGPTGWTADTGYPNVREFKVKYNFLGLTAGSPKTVGVLFNLFTTSIGDVWPAAGDLDVPDTWGDMASSDNWAPGPPNVPPVLSTPTVSPMDGDTTTDFRFEVMYLDADDQEARVALIYINGIVHDMVTDSTGPWDVLVTFYLETKLPAGDNHTYFYIFSDGEASTRFPRNSDTPNWLQGPVVAPLNTPPVLARPMFSPNNGTRLDQYEFTINYTDTDGDAPALATIYLDGVPFGMEGEQTDYLVGVTFRFSTLLDIGEHGFYFLFSDSDHDVRFPTAGSLDGPTVYNLDPLADISVPSGGVRYTPDEYIPFSAEGSSDPEGDELSYLWSSDMDGTLDTRAAFEKRLSTGYHNITLTVTDQYGGTDSTKIPLLVKPRLPHPFLVDYAVSIPAPIETDIVEFIITLDNDGEANALGVEVTFSIDGVELANDIVSVAMGTQSYVVFTWFSTAGDHVFRFDIEGDHIEFPLKVAANTVPTADIVITGGEGDPPRFRVGHQVTFSIDVEDAEGDALALEWDLGDGLTVSDLEEVSHAYLNAGTYQVTITITDARGGSTFSTITIVVDANGLPIMEINGSEKAVKGKTVTFSAEISDPDGDTWTIQWDFGDGAISTEEARARLREGGHLQRDPHRHRLRGWGVRGYLHHRDKEAEEG
jgi:PKD repeat protein